MMDKRERTGLSEAKFTKGPWFLESSISPKGRARISAKRWKSLAKVVIRMEGDENSCDDGLANAHLIAAAPELYEALRMTAKDLNTAAHFLPDTGLALLETVKQANAALAKVRGEA